MMDAHNSGDRALIGFVPPLKVHLCWFEGQTSNTRCSAMARDIYELLHRRLQDDVVLRPGLEIPIEYGRDLVGLLDGIERGAEPAVTVRLVIVLLDSVAYGQARVRRIFTDRALTRWISARTDEVLLPVVLDDRWQAILKPHGLTVLTAVSSEDDVRDDTAMRWQLCAKVAVAAGRALLRQLHSAAPLTPRIFISHTLGDAATLVNPLVARVRAELPDNPWFELDSHRGDDLARRIENAGLDAIALVVRTDRYFETPSCRDELRAAKRAGMPTVTLLATRDGESWTSEHSGNHRTLQWALGREWEIVTRCLQVWLDHHHFRAYAAAALERAGLPVDTAVVPRRPELLDVVGAMAGVGRRLVVHPDPPMTAGEGAEIRRAVPSVRLATPTTLFGRVLLARDPEPPLAGTTVAFSLSVAEDLPFVEDGHVGSGLTQQQLDDVLYSIVVAALSSGARIAYGGDFRGASGYAKKLSDLHRSWGKLGPGPNSQLVCFLDAEEGAAGRPGDAVDEIEFDPVDVPAIAGAEDFPAQRSLLWHMAMRERMAQDSHGRILLGGKTRSQVEPDDGGYSGPWPGLLEEAWRTVQWDRALYVVGGFGGAAGLIARMLERGELPDELTAARRAGTRVDQVSRDFDVARAALLSRGIPARLLGGDGTLQGIEDMARSILSRWTAFVAGDAAAWANGLSVPENRQLFRSTDRTEITHLVFSGLRRLARPSTPRQISWALFPGDMTSVPDVDGYAVTATPNVPPMGAMAVLDARMDGRLSRLTWQAGSDVALAQVAAGELAGRQVLVARLALPPAGQLIAAGAVRQVVEEIARRADEVGFASIACPMFGTMMGLSVQAAVSATVDGFTANSRIAKTIVICEADRARYAQLRTLLPGAVELRADTLPAASERSVVLHLQAVPPTSANPYGRLDTTLFAPHETDPVVPQGNARLIWPQWFEIRDRYVDFDKTLRMGRLLWQAFLTDSMRARITGDANQRLVVLTDKHASGLPWEILAGDDSAPIALSCDVVRRVALEGAATRPAPATSRGARVRVLIVVNPANLRNAVVEADAVAAALGARADVEIKRIGGPGAPEATLTTVRDELASGFYDVLHYTGHAAFDEQNPGREGLHLIGGILTGELLPAVAPPRLVFLSACESGRLRRDAGQPEAPVSNGLSIAETFLRRGVAALLGTFLAVDDRTACSFATTVHTQLASGRPLGLAVRVARKTLYDAQSPDWGNFMLFGDNGLVL